MRWRVPPGGAAIRDFGLGLFGFRKNLGYQSGYFLEDKAKKLHSLLISIGI